MIYSDYKGMKLSMLGFGAMRLPLNADGAIDEKQTAEMVRYAIENGVNYFDTAYPYHGGNSEIVMGKILKDYPRESFYLATKYPGHQISESYDPAEVFEHQLQKCGVEYFDFYLLHNVNEGSFATYTDPKWGIVDYFVEQKRLGRIRHLGFSSHAAVPCMREFLKLYGGKMDFCQIQLNYLDWTLQDGKGKCAALAEYGIPVWVMEPVRGGKLAVLSEENEAKLKAFRPEASPAEWCFRWQQSRPDVKVVLSGMSTLEQVKENVATFAERKPVNSAEEAALMAIAEELKSAVPCTACRYCCDGCPQGLDIPMLLGLYNEMRIARQVNIGIRIDSLPEDKRPAACIACGQCTAICPQQIDIPDALQKMNEIYQEMPKWADLCKQREEALKKMKAEKNV